jgi:hypothetical protein
MEGARCQEARSWSLAVSHCYGLRVAGYGVLIAQRAKRMAHSVQIDNSEISEKSNAMPYALCPLNPGLSALCFEFWSFDIRISFGFLFSCFGF